MAAASRRLRLTYVLGLLVALVAILYAGSYYRGAAPERPVAASALAVPASDVEVQVLNEGGVSHGALRLARYLREKGFDVVEFGNGSQTGRQETEVIVRGEDTEKGARVARAIDCKILRVEKDPSLLLDVTVLVGKDVETLVKLSE